MTTKIDIRGRRDVTEAPTTQAIPSGIRKMVAKWLHHLQFHRWSIIAQPPINFSKSLRTVIYLGQGGLFT